MKEIELIPVSHNTKIGSKCLSLPANIKDDALFMSQGEIIGFYIRRMPENMCKLADIANTEFNSKRVPKQKMNRTSGEQGHTERIRQYSTIIGAVPPRPHMGRPYAAICSVHREKSATTFIKAMIKLAKESELLIKKYMPKQYETQLGILSEVDDKWKIGSLFTSSISNSNVAANYHQDNANIKNSVNVIITKRWASDGGNLHVPDYDAVIDQCDNSMLVYPAWRNVHGVTPIIERQKGGYRNSLVFYPLKAFLKL